ncbi:MAG: hypothetical protein FWE82_09035, partial [Defluviitaleaceae bacterium]|nr:hypothetical protein [Defluviitaleaceae bacterium]
ETVYAQLWHNIYVRCSDGSVDVVQYYISSDNFPFDAVVLKNGIVSGLNVLEEGDPVEYLVNKETGKVLYIYVPNNLSTRIARGRLQSVDWTNKNAVFLDLNGREYVYSIANGLFGTTNGVQYLHFTGERRTAANLPIGSLVSISLVNNMITGITYVGESVLYPETYGIVIENNAMLGFLTVANDEGQIVSKTYNPANLIVQKREYYDMRDTIGQIHSMFPDLDYNPRITSMDSIEPGDIVSFRTDEKDDGVIVSISAAVNYTTRYGVLREFYNDGIVSSFLIEYENGKTAWFTMPNSAYVTKNGRPSSPYSVRVGDWVRILINQAVSAPGHIMESVKEMQVENEGHLINEIAMGKLTHLNMLQNKIQLTDVQTLTKNGWDKYKPVVQFNLAGKNTEFFIDGRPVTISFVNNYLRYSDANVYIALENNFAGDIIRKVSFRTGRDEILPPDTIFGTDSNGGFHILANDGMITTDPGTIVRRNGRLVDGRSIFAPDYAVVALCGHNTAAVVDITDPPSTAGVNIVRGRIYSVDHSKSFRVQSMSVFDGHNWLYTPIQREFTIDYNTMYFNENGLVSSESFIDFTEDSVIHKVFTIVTDGARAARVIEAPFVTQAVRGIIYAVNGNSISIRNASYYNEQTGRYLPVSNVNATVEINIMSNSLIIDRDKLIGANSLSIGDQIKIMTNTLPDVIAGGMQIDGYIVLVEK